jgi:hypothetical protein
MKRARVDESADKSEDHVTKNFGNGAKIPSVRVSKTVKACEYLVSLLCGLVHFM